jgi:hypothetical protein
MTAPGFALAIGLLYAALGLLGMLSSLVLPAAVAPGASVPLFGYLFGLFAVNLVLNGVHFLVGVWGLVAWAGALSAVTYARSIALLLGAMALFGLMPGLLAALMPLHGHNVWLHGVSAALAAWVGFRTLARRELAALKPQRAERRVRGERRVSARPVARERRRGADDRRLIDYSNGERYGPV